MNKISYAENKDKSAVMNLWAEAFGQEEPYFSWYFKNIYRPELTICLFKEERIVSSLQYAPHTLFLHGQKQKVAYIVGLCTTKAAQGQGYAHLLLRYILKELQESYHSILLFTDIPRFYQSLGFTHCYYLHRHKFKAAYDAGVAGKWCIGTLADDDIIHYDNIYQKMTMDFDGYLIRDKTSWKNFLEDFLCDNGSLYLCEDAYLLWLIEDGLCKIKEIGYTDQTALKKALQLGSHIAKTKGFDSIIWDAPQVVPILSSKKEIIPHVMAVSCDALINSKENRKTIVADTKALFGNCKKLWLNEIT